MTTHILVPTDGSDRAEAVIRRAMEHAGEGAATLHLLFVVDTRRYGEPALSSTEVLIDCFEDDGREHLAALVEAGDRRDVRTESYCRHGDPVEETARAATDIGVDVVIPCIEGVTPRILERRGIDRRRVVDTRAARSA